ncbi:hypothetical protein HGRIS_003909 [Hohenbuehelia grisea]|uniref:Uncharacterized protein n=1 Tax=Hohenbuehelia grisea TaxID=104357 RepID=A0ABR3JGW6_9AGAR
MAQERQQFERRIRSALEDEEDPLAVYQEYVQWILKHDPNPEAAVFPVLEEATQKFKDDSIYKADLRYVKIVTSYTQRLPVAEALRLLKQFILKEIGTTYSVLYEEYALALERLGRLSDADAAYRRGIKRQARPVERLKTRYREFQSRHPTLSGSISVPSQPLHSAPNATSTPLDATNDSPSASASSKASPGFPPATHPYEEMLTYKARGKRSEKLRFDLALLFTEDHVEYSIQEARARSMGLLGKKWGPPPPVELTRSSRYSPSSSDSEGGMSEEHDEDADDEDGDIAMELNDDNRPATRIYGARKSLGFGTEPTVTINTKEALADVFGMYNSPDKTITTRYLNGGRVGSKHALVKKVEVSTPGPVNSGLGIRNLSTPAANPQTPAPSFKPFIDEPQSVMASSKKENATPAPKFKPYVDQEPSKTPFAEQALKPSFTTPRHALAPKDPLPHATPSPADEDERPRMLGTGIIKVTKLNAADEEGGRSDDGFSIYSPPSTTLKDKNDSSAQPFKPFVDDDSGARATVFSRPPSQDAQSPRNADQAVPNRPASFTPFRDRAGASGVKPSFAPYRDQGENAQHVPAWQSAPQEVDTGDSQYETDPSEEEDDFDDDGFDADQMHPSLETPVHSGESDFDEYGEGDSAYQQEIPLGGRFGAFNVMTPITERTLEFTSTRSLYSATPSDHRGHAGSLFAAQQEERVDESAAVQTAERLAAELQEGDEDDHDIEQPRMPSEEADDDRDVREIETRASRLSLADALTRSSNFRPSNPCNPFDPSVISTLLTWVTSDSDFHDLRHQDAKSLDGLQRFAKKARKTSSNSNSGALDAGSTYPLTLGDNKFRVSEKLGEGAFGAVFKAMMVTNTNDEDGDDDDMDEDVDEDDVPMVALKVVKPRNLWEYHVLRRLHSTLPPHLQCSVVQPQALYAFKDESFLVLELSPQGTLLGVVNSAVSAGVSQQGACLDELLVVFFAVELLRLIEGMHAAGFIHGDLKIDNCLLRLEEVPGGASAWGSTYSAVGKNGWASKGVRVIDFGRTIDTKLFPAGQKFLAEWPADERDCPEIREDRPWTYETDYYGLAGIIYCMLFGKYMQSNAVAEVVENGQRRLKIATPFKRYWQTEMWGSLFEVLLNSSAVKPDGSLPVCGELGAIRAEMEAWLEKNCNRTSGTLKGLLKKVEMSVLRGM